ncbi:MAG TPA: amino acid ABC transporter permease [Ferrovibrio sp.]|uniref:amino acid ABC transporter permease n=1 Tax=Ferrovibrio sp. TaxID=1917215 RepID=UPI002B4B80E3|nr:amino acid ABC transporter permease [Ferrovibrio sp.]HLT77335.1 amino acid ABC transporter permease [Ferrovibrio sp.]
MANNRAGRAPARRLNWNDPDVRSVVYQVVALALVGLIGWFLVSNTLHNLSVRNIASGFGFLERESGFAIGESPISFGPENTYGRAVLVGVLNTLRVAVVGIVLATIIGTIIGIARLSKNWLVNKLATVYVEVVRNVPLLLQLFFWYAIITETLPGPRQALNPIPGVFISNRGVKIPTPTDHFAFDLAGIGFLLGIVLAVLVSRWAKKRQDATGQSFPVYRAGIALILGLPILGWLIGGAPLELNVPKLQGFNHVGGATLTPEFAALLAGLVIYTAGFIAEVVRSGIQAVSHGQTEAAAALGLRRNQILRLVVLPQALRIIIPPMTSQYLNLTKNSSLAVAIGYPDIVSIANTTLNQTGQAIEGILIIMAVYLTISISISIFMNWYNKHIALVER